MPKTHIGPSGPVAASESEIKRTADAQRAQKTAVRAAPALKTVPPTKPLDRRGLPATS